MLLASGVTAQVAVEFSKMNVAYIGLDNPIEFYAKNGEQVTAVPSSQGAKVIERDGQFYIQAKKRGDCRIDFINPSGDTLGSFPFRIRPIPSPKLKLGILGNHSRASSGMIRAQPYVVASLGEGFAFEGVRYVVRYYEVTTITPFEVCRFKQSHMKIDNAPQNQFGGALQIHIDKAKFTLQSDSIQQRKPSAIDIYIKRYHSNYLHTEMKFTNAKVSCLDSFHLEFMDNLGEHYHAYKSDKNLLLLKETDTLLYISNQGTRTFDSTGSIFGVGTAQKLMIDSLTEIEIEGAYTAMHFRFGLSDSLGLPIKLPSRYYPTGTWQYYHSNGALRAEGTYGQALATRRVQTYHISGADLLTVKRKGIWKFYDTTGKLTHSINYDNSD